MGHNNLQKNNFYFSKTILAIQQLSSNTQITFEYKAQILSCDLYCVWTIKRVHHF